MALRELRGSISDAGPHHEWNRVWWAMEKVVECPLRCERCCRDLQEVYQAINLLASCWFGVAVAPCPAGPLSVLLATGGPLSFYTLRPKLLFLTSLFHSTNLFIEIAFLLIWSFFNCCRQAAMPLATCT